MSADTATAPLMTIDEACRYGRFGRRMYFRLQERGEGPPETRIGRRVFVRRDTLDMWLRSREQPANAPVVPTPELPSATPDFNDPATLRAALLGSRHRTGSIARFGAQTGSVASRQQGATGCPN